MNNNESLEHSILIHFKPLPDNKFEFIGIRLGTWDENRNDLRSANQDSDDKMDVLIPAEILDKEQENARAQIMSVLNQVRWVNITEEELKKAVNSLI